MPANYFYLFSSLPLLDAGGEPPLSSAAFLDYLGYHLDPGDLGRLTAASLVPGETAATVVERAWYAFETALRNQLVRHRASQLRRDPQEHLRPETAAYGGLDSHVTEALGRPDPAQREAALDDLRWQVISDLEVTHPYSFEGLVAYRLKLLLLEKRALLDAAAGRQRLDNFEKMQTKHVDTPELANAE